MIDEGPFDGNVEQRAMIEDSIAKAMLYRIREKTVQPEIPPLVKWLVGAIAAFGTASLIGLGFWLVSSVSTMRETLARMDERQVMSSQALAERFQAIDTRFVRLETEGGGRR